MPMGAAPMRCIGGAGTQASAQGGVSGPRTPHPISCCCPRGGGNAEQEAHDEPSKHKSISSPVTRVTRVGHHHLLMLGASTCHGVGAQRGPWGPREGHDAAKGLAGAPRLCGSCWGGWQCPLLWDGDSQPCPRSQGRGDSGDAGAWQDVAGCLCRSAPSCHAAPCAAGKTLGSTGCQVCSCPAAIACGEGQCAQG